MAALTPESNAHSSPQQVQKSSGDPADQWEEWMEWDPSTDGLPEQQSISPSSTSGQESDRRPLISPLSRSDGHDKFFSTGQPKKRKAPEETSGTASIGQGTTGRLTSAQNKSHSLVEKRYRTNLNDKISELRQNVPSLRDADQSSNKATILTKAIEYIQYLEKRNAFLEEMNDVLKCQKWDSTTTLSEDKSTLREDTVRSPSSDHSSSPCANGSDPTISVEPRGMISVPEDLRKFRESGRPQSHYADSICPGADTDGTSLGGVSVRRGKLVSKLMLGSLAGLMVVDGLSGNSEESRERGLSSLPIFSSFSPVRLVWTLEARMTNVSSSHLLIPLTRAFLIFAALGIILFLYLFNSKPKLGKLRVASSGRDLNPSTSPMGMRENAWLTAIQTVWVPRHTMLPELWALILETHAYLTRQVLGWQSYSCLTGRSEEDEIARIRAWEIAIDAQLAGGDTEISRSRLVLTLWAGGTLPPTPARLMLKALHLRITFWQASRFLWMTHLIDRAGRYLACSQWISAQAIINNPTVSKNPGPSDPLPDHLVSLLQLPIDEIMNDCAVQYAHNLAWNREVLDDIGNGEVDIALEDTVMLGSLDTLAAWTSSIKLHSALVNMIDFGESNTAYLSQLEVALRTAPPGSLSSIRALAATASLSAADRKNNIACVMSNYSNRDSLAAAASFPSDAPRDVLIVLDCALALDMLASAEDRSSSLRTALQVFDRASRSWNMELLTFAAMYRLMAEISKHPDLVGKAASSFRQSVSDQIMQMDELAPQGNNNYQGLCEKYKAALQKIELPDSTERRVSVSTIDTGYGSMIDDDHAA